MTDDVDNIHAPPKPTILDMRRALEYIASYERWDFSKVRDPHKWCNEFIDVARKCLDGKEFFA